MNNFTRDVELHEGQQNRSLSRDVEIALAVVCIITFFVGAIGNATVLALFIKYRSLRTSSNTFVINLAIPDLMMCIICLPMLIHYYIREEVESDVHLWFCRVNNFFGALTGFLSIWSLVCLAFDRCIVIRRRLPIRYSSDKVIAHYVIAAVWVCSLIIAALPLYGYGRLSIEGVTNSCDASETFRKSAGNMMYNISIQILFFVIPIVCITSCYYIIYTKVRQHEKIYFNVRQSGQYDEVSFRRMRKRKKLERIELKTAKVGLTLITLFCVAWTPYSVVSWIGLLGDRDSVTPLMIVIPAITAKILTLLNPILYALSLQSFKIKLRLFCIQYFKVDSSQFGSIDRSFPLAGAAANLHNNSCYVPRPCSDHRTCNVNDNFAQHKMCTLPKTCSIPRMHLSVCNQIPHNENKIVTTTV